MSELRGENDDDLRGRDAGMKESLKINSSTLLCILPSPNWGCNVFFAPNPIDEEWVIALIQAGMGMSIMPEWTPVNGVTYVPIANTDPPIVKKEQASDRFYRNFTIVCFTLADNNSVVRSI